MNDNRQRLVFTPRESLIIHLRSGCLRAVLFVLIWWILTDGAMASWWLGTPVILFATVVSVMLLPPFSAWSFLGTARFIPFFLWRSLHGGVDVARRALHPQLPIAPMLFDYVFRLPPGLPRVFMANTVSLLPGTLGTELGVNCLHVHVLDERKDFFSELEKVEQRVAAMFRIALPSSNGGGRNETIQ